MISLTALVERGRSQAGVLLQTLQTWPWLDTLRTLRQRFREDRLGVTASSLTFTTTIALVPLATVMLAVFTAFPMFQRFEAALQKYFLQNLVPDSLAKPVLGALTQFALKANRLGTVGLVLLVLTAIALLLTIDRTLNGIWRVRQPRPFTQRVLIYWAAATLGPLMLGVSLTLTSYAISVSEGLVSALPGGVAFLLNTVEIVLLATAMAGLFRYVPNTHVRWAHAWAGGIFVALGFEAAKRLLTWYLSQVPTYSTVYGAFSAVPIFLIWLYLGWVIVLLGAVIAAYAPSLSMRVTRRPRTAGHMFALAMAVMRTLVRARQEDHKGLSLAGLAQAMRVDPLQIEPVLEAFVRWDWAGRLDEGGAQRYVWMADPAVTAAEPMVSQWLLEPSADAQSMWRYARIDALKLQDLLAH